MPPGGKTLQGVGRHLQCHHTGKGQRAQRQGDGADITGTEKRDDQKGTEEDQRRTEIVHKRQAAAKHGRIYDEQEQIPFLDQAVHCGCAHECKADLAQLRRL